MSKTLLIVLLLLVLAGICRGGWERTYGGSANDEGSSVVQTADGGYIVVGYGHTIGGQDVYIVKTDSIGNMIWERTYGVSGCADWAESVSQISDSGYIVTGYTRSFGTGGYDDISLRPTPSAM